MTCRGQARSQPAARGRKRASDKKLSFGWLASLLLAVEHIPPSGPPWEALDPGWAWGAAHLCLMSEQPEISQLVTAVFRAWQQAGINFLVLRNYERPAAFHCQ